MLTAAVEEVPAPLFDQLAPDGVLVAPVGPADDRQMLTRFARHEGSLERKELGWVRFVPMVGGIASAL